MRLFAEYKFEREGMSLYETECGFILFKPYSDLKLMLISELFVTLEKRHNGLGRELADFVFAAARAQGLERVICQCCPSPTCSDSLRGILEYGFKVERCENSGVWLTKDVN